MLSYDKDVNNNAMSKNLLPVSDKDQEKMADQISQEIFHGVDNSDKTTGLIRSFVQSYEQHKHEQTLEEWLIAEFKKHPQAWSHDAEAENSAHEVIEAITRSNEAKASLHASLDKGNSQARWLAKQIENGAAASSINNVGQYAYQIEKALKQANQSNWDVIIRKDGLINQNPSLDGFIAEHHHANTFNIDAAAKGSPLRARVIEPAPGETYGKNSMDIGIYDAEGKLVGRYQSKYGADADATNTSFENGDYRGQQKLVPAGQGKDIKNSVETLEKDGVSSKPLSKEEAKALQKRAQQENEAKQYEWRDGNRSAIARQIGKQALIGAAITAGMQGARILARRAWNRLQGKENPCVSEDLQEFFESSIKSAACVGVQVAVSGAVVVAVKSGWLGALLKNTPAGRIANAVYVGLENAKVLLKLHRGELSHEEALDAMGQTTITAISALIGATEGATLGAALGSVLGPLGVLVGGFVGGVAGGIAGSSISEDIYEGGKVIAGIAVNRLRSMALAVGEGIKNVGESISNFGRGIVSLFS